MQGLAVRRIDGNGDGTFTPAPGSPIALGGGTPTSIAVGDFNTDGKPDLAIGTAAPTTVDVLLGNGDGSLRPASGSPVALAGTAPYVTGLAAADFNGDGKPDLAVASGSLPPSGSAGQRDLASA